jgi:hypothetical protein
MKGRQAKEFFYSAIQTLLPATGLEPAHLLRGTGNFLPAASTEVFLSTAPFKKFQE